ncbi:hypothetical protein M0804_000183 [Polistes exclamans]|nr:hypothetical protein M0804_000183 [Polistes exclamans]
MYHSKRKFHLLFGISASVAVYCINLMPHTIFLNKLEETVAFYRHGIRVRINNEMKELCKEVMNDLQLPESTQSLIKPFHVFGFQPFHAGTLNKTFGGIIGIPINFLYKEPADAAVEKLIINNKEFNKMRREADNLYDSLIISKDAKKYVIAREISKIIDNGVYVSGGGLSCIIFIMTSIYSNLVHKFNMYEKKASYRRTLYVVFILIGFVLWLVFKDVAHNRIENNIDEKIAKLGLNYINGGKEYYEKELQKNIALRSLMEEDGKKQYNADGNEKHFWMHLSISLSERKRFFESKL